MKKENQKALPLLALLLAGQWMERRGVPLEDFRQPYVELQELESTPVVLFDPSSGHDSRSYREPVSYTHLTLPTTSRV